MRAFACHVDEAQTLIAQALAQAGLYPFWRGRGQAFEGEIQWYQAAGGLFHAAIRIIHQAVECAVKRQIAITQHAGADVARIGGQFQAALGFL